MQTPLIIAHRARTENGLENTAASIQAAAATGADLIELDVRLTLDRQPVVFHDAFLGRLTHRHGPIGLFPAALLPQLSALPGGDAIPIPYLRHVVRDVPVACQLALHLKSRRAIHPVLSILRKQGSAGRTWLWLEHMDDVYLATRTLPELRCTLLRPGAWTPSRRDDYFREAQASGARAVSVPGGAVSPDLVRQAHQHHLSVFSRIDHIHLLPELAANGLDGVITADPAGAVALLRSIGRR